MRGQHRIGTILEVNPQQGKIVFKDKYKGQIQLTFHLHDAIATVPRQGEVWMVVDQGSGDWVLEKKLEDNTSHLPLTALNPGDKRYDTSGTSHVLGNFVNISGVQGVNIGSTNVNVGQTLSVQGNNTNITGNFDANGSPVLTLATLPTPTFTLTNSGSLVGQSQIFNLISGTNININTWESSNGILNAEINAIVPPVPTPTIGFELNGSLKGKEANFNLIPVSGTAITLVDNPNNNRVDAYFTTQSFPTVRLYSHANALSVPGNGTLNLLETVGSITYPANSFVQIEYIVSDINFPSAGGGTDTLQIDLYDSGSTFLATLGYWQISNSNVSDWVEPFYGKLFYQTKSTPTIVNFTIMGTASTTGNPVTLNATGARSIRTIVTWPINNFTKIAT